MEIKGKSVVITGGASGLGEGTARLFHELGAKITVFDLNDARGDALVSELGGDIQYRSVNVTDEEQVSAALDAAQSAFGGVDVCLNYAGIGDAAKTVGKDGPLPLAKFKKVIDVNLIGSFNVLRLAAHRMAANTPDADGQRGVIVNTASVAAYEGQVGQAAYSASKGGIVGMTLPIARDLASIGVRCCTIAPGLIHTPLFESLPKEAYDSLSKSPVFPQRLGQANEIARTAQFIVENNYMNGETIRVDAGIRMQPR
ncbi:MAG: SDR family NAD(P)-dependent oxidoreductase [Pseudomonadota bacterium]